MNNQETYEFCDVIGCRKPAAVVQKDTQGETEEWLCEACYRNLNLSDPDMAANYRQIGAVNSSINQAPGLNQS
jgi:hypothetical protein